jgi:hypothetical protein
MHPMGMQKYDTVNTPKPMFQQACSNATLASSFWTFKGRIQRILQTIFMRNEETHSWPRTRSIFFSCYRLIAAIGPYPAMP